MHTCTHTHIHTYTHTHKHIYNVIKTTYRHIKTLLTEALSLTSTALTQYC